jgi:hypothetical protein
MRLATIAAALLVMVPAVRAQQAPAPPPDLTAKIAADAEIIRKHLDLLRSDDVAVRTAAFRALADSGHPVYVDLAIDAAIASGDPVMRALAVRAGFRQVRSLSARLTRPPVETPATEEVAKVCGEAVQYTIEGYDPATGRFEARASGQSGVGNISGATVSITLEYGCSVSGILVGRRFQGHVTAPYNKGIRAMEMTFRDGQPYAPPPAPPSAAAATPRSQPKGAPAEPTRPVRPKTAPPQL